MPGAPRCSSLPSQTAPNGSADPKARDTVYVLNVQFHKSTDCGKTFKSIRVPHGDNHDLWIAPDNPERMVEANDGGANVSTNGGQSWTGQSWTGQSWTGKSWTGQSWTGKSWTGQSWTGQSWTGQSWTSSPTAP